MFAGAACVAATLLIGATSVGHSEQSGFEFMEVNSHHFSSGQATERTGLIRKERDNHDGSDVQRDHGVSLFKVDRTAAAVNADGKAEGHAAVKTGTIPKICGAHTADSCADCPSSQSDQRSSACAADSTACCEGECQWDSSSTTCENRVVTLVGETTVTWGQYTFETKAHDCIEYGATNLPSAFAVWSGTTSGLTLSQGTVLTGDYPTEEASGGLRIFKTACSNATATTVGGEMTIPAIAKSIELIFGLVTQCTGDCAPLMVTVKQGSTGDKVHRWCFNRQGNAAPDVTGDCDVTESVDYNKWLKRSFDLTNFSDTGGSLKLALETYTSGDYRWLEGMSGQVGTGGRAEAIIDTLLFPPYSNPSTDNTDATVAVACRESLANVCDKHAVCNDKYRCHSGFCAAGSTRCNGHRNCADESDEVGCQVSGGFEAEFWTTHADDIRNNVAVDGLSNPDLRVMGDLIEYDRQDFWTKAHAKDYFAARWRGNFSLGEQGRYSWRMVNSGTATLKISSMQVQYGDPVDLVLTDLNHAGAQSNWRTFSSGTYQLTLEFIHTTGNPHIELKYVGTGTQGTAIDIQSSEVSAQLRGPHCDAVDICANGLSLKADASDRVCEKAPCEASRDTNACCVRKYKAISAGDYRSCAIDLSGKPVCWGDTGDQWKKNVETDGTATTFLSLSTRAEYTCGVKEADSFVVCWKPDQATSTLDYSHDSVGGFTNVSVGDDYVCGRRTNGYVACTGNYNPVNEGMPTNELFDKVASGKNFWCGIKSSGKGVFCMGQDNVGQVSVPDNIKNPATADVGMIDIDAGKDHVCVVNASGGHIHCWGGNNDTQATPPTGAGFTKVAAGGKHSCALKSDGEAHCWGSNANGQSDVPVYKTTSGATEKVKLSAIASGEDHTCGIREEDQEVVCWGSNYKPASGGTNSFVGQSIPPRAEAITYG